MTTGLTPARRRVLDALRRVLDREGSASAREVAAEAGLSSHSATLVHLHHLADAGVIVEPRPGRARDWRLPPPPPAPPVVVPTEQPRDPVGRYSTNRPPVHAFDLLGEET